MTVTLETVLWMWFGVSLLVHIPVFRGLRKFINLGGLLPNWYLFTADLLVRDLRLRVKVREQSRDLEAEWQDVPMRHLHKSFHALWNPRRRITKALFDSCDAIVQARLQGRRDQIPSSRPYRILASWVRNSLPGDSGLLFRFCLALRSRTGPYLRNDIVFLSPELSTIKAEKRER